MREEVIIIGGGIAGLTTAYKLKRHGIKALVLEASDRLGGRIYTKTDAKHLLELGATWVFQDPVLKQLIKDLGLSLYPQYLMGDALIKYDQSMSIQKSPTAALMNGAVYHKVEGGTGAVIEALAQRLDIDRVRLNNNVVELSFQDELVKLTLDDGSILESAIVIIAAPPKSIAENVKFNLSPDFMKLMSETHTWMGESTKFTVILDRDYWRSKYLSGFVYSNYGLIREIQDHSAENGQTFGLVGFLQPEGKLIKNFEMRRKMVFQELNELFNIQQSHILAYDDFLWYEYFEDGQSINYNAHLSPHQNNGHSFYQQSHFDGHLFFAGAETSMSNPGYMEGAVSSANSVVKLLLKTSQ